METELTGAGNQGGQTGEVSQAGSDQGGVQQSVGWRESLPQEIRGEKSFDVFKGKDWNEVGPTMAKSYLEAEKKFGSAVWLPKKDATPEEKEKALNDIYNKLGRPGKPEEYEYTKPYFKSKDINWDDEMAKDFLNVAHQIGLNNSQAQALINWQGNLIEGKATNARQQVNQTLETLKKEWGPNYENRLIVAERAVREVGGDKLVNLLESTGLGNHPVLINVFAEIGDILAEDGLIDGRVGGGSIPEDINAKIEGMMMDKKHPLNDISHPGHKAAVEEYTKLNQSLFASKR